MNAYQVMPPEALCAMGSEIRQDLLAALAEPNSAVGLAKRFSMSRQRVGYHMRDLERAGCIHVVGERAQRGLTEKLYQVTPRVFAQAPVDWTPPSQESEFSFARLLNTLGHALSSLMRIKQRADAQGKDVPTLSITAPLCFPSAQARAAFSADLIKAVETVLKRHEYADAPDGRRYRLILGAFPELPNDETREGDPGDQHEAQHEAQ